VKAIAKRYAGRGESVDDLIQVGSLGLIRASDRFDPDRGVAFATFATPAIEGEIRRHLGDRTPPVRIPRDLQRMSGQLQRCRAQLGASLGRAPSIDEIAVALGVEREDIERGLEAERAREATPRAAEDADDTGEYEFHSATDDRLLLGLAARALNERERRIVFLRFHADMTERDIAQVLGISQAHVSRLLADALSKLREELDERKVSPEVDDIGQEAVISPTKHDAKPESRSHKRRKIGVGGAVKTKIAPVGASQQKAERAADDSASGELVSRGRKQKAASTASGRFLVRMPSELHQELALAAEREQVSLNRFVTDALAASVGTEEANPVGPSGASDDAQGVTERRRSFRMLLAANVIVIVIAAAAAVALLVLALERGL
jgi:RNA polymerase sigma-B factor